MKLAIAKKQVVVIFVIVSIIIVSYVYSESIQLSLVPNPSPVSSPFGTFTFGKNTVGTSEQACENYIRTSFATCPQNGLLDSITAYIRVGTATHNVKCALYEYINYYPDFAGSLISSTEEKSLPAGSASWVTFNFPSKPAVSWGTNYYLAIWAGTASGDVYIKFDTSSPSAAGKSQTYGSWQNPMTGETGQPRIYSIYATGSNTPTSNWLQQEIDNAPNGGTVVIPSGTYSFNEPVAITKDLTLAGAGLTSTTLVWNDGLMRGIEVGTGGNTVTFKDFSIHMVDQDYASTCIDVFSSSQATFQRIKFYQCQIGICAAYVNNMLVEDCRFENLIDDGVVTHSYNDDYFTFDSCIFSNSASCLEIQQHGNQIISATITDCIATTTNDDLIRLMRDPNLVGTYVVNINSCTFKSLSCLDLDGGSLPAADININNCEIIDVGQDQNVGYSDTNVESTVFTAGYRPVTFNIYQGSLTLHCCVGPYAVAHGTPTVIPCEEVESLFERYNVASTSAYNIYGANWKAQTFTIGNTGQNTAHSVTKVILKLSKNGVPSGDLVISIRATAGGKPTSGPDLATCTIPCSVITGTNWYTITFTVPYVLNPSTMYSIVVRAPSCTSSSNCVTWCNVGPAGGYTGGALITSTTSGSTWNTPTSSDFVFEEWGL
jgi:hypothetical protein